MKLFNKKVKKITLYEGTIKRVFANGYTLEKEITPIIQREEVRKGLFYKSIFDFVEVESGHILPTEEEALHYTTKVANSHKQEIYDILANPSISSEEKETFLQTLKNTSSCIYLDAPNFILKPVKEVTKQELKELKKRK